MEKCKDQASEQFIDVIIKSWTWEKLTSIERERFFNLLPERPSGTFEQRYDCLSMIYRAYLHGLGYQPIGWRESEAHNV
jgi:hypothetical protein